MVDCEKVTYLVFAQSEAGEVPTKALAAQALRFFEASIEAQGAADTAPSAADAPKPPFAARLVLDCGGARAAFSVAVRPITATDVLAAREAEARSRAGGLSDLAARCQSVYEVSPEAGVLEWQALTCSALIASVTLGPILPPNRDALLGVRSARERAEAAERLKGS